MLFPKTVFVEENTIEKQLEHIGTEFQEIVEEVYPQLRNGKNYDAIAGELWDLIQSAETALRILDEQHGVEINLIRQGVYEKNRARRYYKEA
jgi:NTP pyrophosphatase (non-canonical NTP hydrolase)